MPPLRWTLLAVALAATIVASLIDLEPPDVVPARGTSPARAQAASPAVSKPSAGQAEQFARARFEPRAADLFAPHNWQPKPVPPLPPAPPPPVAAPRAPPLPFVYLGKLLEDGQVMAFLGQGSRTHLLRRGDVLAPYRVDEITPSQMTLVYLPLNEKQQLTFGSAN